MLITTNRENVVTGSYPVDTVTEKHGMPYLPQIDLYLSIDSNRQMYMVADKDVPKDDLMQYTYTKDSGFLKYGISDSLLTTIKNDTITEVQNELNG